MTRNFISWQQRLLMIGEFGGDDSVGESESRLCVLSLTMVTHETFWVPRLQVTLLDFARCKIKTPVDTVKIKGGIDV